MGGGQLEKLWEFGHNNTAVSEILQTAEVATIESQLFTLETTTVHEGACGEKHHCKNRAIIMRPPVTSKSGGGQSGAPYFAPPFHTGDVIR